MSRDKLYRARHALVNAVRGAAKLHPCEICGVEGKAQWATIRGKTGIDPMDYFPLCPKCHHAYDWEIHRATDAKRGLAQRGKPKSAEARANMSKAAMGKVLSLETRQKMSAVRAGVPHPHGSTRRKSG